MEHLSRQKFIGVARSAAPLQDDLQPDEQFESRVWFHDNVMLRPQDVGVVPLRCPRTMTCIKEMGSEVTFREKHMMCSRTERTHSSTYFN